MDEIGKISEFALFFRILPVSRYHFMQVYSPFARASVFIRHCFNGRHERVHDVIFKMSHREMLKLMINNGGKRKYRLLNEINWKNQH